MEYLPLAGYGVYWNEEEEGRLNEPGDMVGGGSQLRNEEEEEMLCVRMGGGLLVDKHLALFSLSLWFLLFVFLMAMFGHTTREPNDARVITFSSYSGTLP